MSAYLSYLRDFAKFWVISATASERFSVRWTDRFPCLKDKESCTSFDSHYVYHPAWAARILAESKTRQHVDISSTLHFCTLVSAFLSVKFYDFRPAELHLPGLTSEVADLLALPFSNNSIDSLSCMHVVEHVGLGRYGDRLDPGGDLTAISELKRVVSKGGSLLFVVPISGKPKILFNAHRIYNYEQITGYFEGFELKEFSLIPDNNPGRGIISHATKEQSDAQNYGCGCFWFIKAAETEP